MTTDSFTSRLAALTAAQETLLDRKNERAQPGNGIFSRFLHPVLTAEHVPLDWRYDFSSKDNPHFMERLGIDAVFNAGALLLEGRYLLMARVEGWDRKSFFAIAESKTGVDGFRFWASRSSCPRARSRPPTCTTHGSPPTRMASSMRCSAQSGRTPTRRPAIPVQRLRPPVLR